MAFVASNPREPSKAVKAGQVVLFFLAMALIGLHAAQSELSGASVNVQIDGTTLELLGLMVVALVLPRIVSFKASASGVEIGLSAAQEGSKEAAQAAGLDTSQATEVSAPLERARSDPLVSIEMSRRTLAQALHGLANAAGIADPAADLTGLAKQLKAKQILPDKAETAIRNIAVAIQQAKSSGQPAPSVAVEIDYGTQLIVGLAERTKQTLQSTPRDESAS